MKTSYSRWLGALLAILILASTFLMMPHSLSFNNDSITDLPAIFASLVLVSMLVERVIEIFVSAFRGAQADHLDHHIGLKQNQIAGIVARYENESEAQKDEEHLTVTKELSDIQAQRMEHRVGSRAMSQWIGIGLGLLLGFVGVRVLGNIVITDNLTGIQLSAFTTLDVLLTGIAIAGGSESINKMMKLYNSVIDSTASRAKR